MPEGLRKRALQLLARREHTRRELQRKLASEAEDSSALDQVLDELEARGWLSETRVAEQLVHTRRSKFGTRRIVHELRERGVSEDTVAAVAGELKGGQLDAARAVWQRKFRNPPGNAAERARQIRFLQGRGFELDVIFKLIKGEE